MKKLNIKTGVLTLFFVLFSICNALAEEVTGFLVDMKIVQQILNSGATDIKIFAAADEKGVPNYILVGVDDQGGLKSDKVYRQNEKGDCPPACDYTPANLANGGSFIGLQEAKDLVDNYLRNEAEASNMVLVCAYSINKVIQKGYNYMQVSIVNGVKITGIKDGGGTNLFSTFSDECNMEARGSLE